MSAKENVKVKGDDTLWTNYVKEYAKDRGLTYKQAMSEAGPSYHEMKKMNHPRITTQRRAVTKTSDKKSRKARLSPSPSLPPEPVVQPQLLVETDNEELLELARTIKSKVCKDKLEKTNNDLNQAQAIHKKQIKDCEDIVYGDFVKRYFKSQKNLTHQELLEGLQRFYKTKKKDNPDYHLTMDEFIHLFSQKMAVENANYKRQHVFEAICRLLLLYNYDGNTFGYNKLFYKSLEGFSRAAEETSEPKILQTPVNESSKSGIVDIFFKTENSSSSSTKSSETKNDEWGCESIKQLTESAPPPPKKFNYIMIQNKYYEVEKSNISHYDVTRIFALSEAYQKHNKIFDDGIPKIVLMVNNEDAVSSNLMRAKQQYQGLLAEGDKGIIGVKRLNEWFEKLLFDLLETNDNEEFRTRIGIQVSASKPLLQPRFHQKFIVDCTERYIKDTVPVSKFIWGAVPRSGKSYMIGGMISKRWGYPENRKNDIVIILGAKTETETQFKDDMFKKFVDFAHYNIFVGSDERVGKQEPQDPNKPTIYLFSQEYLKNKCDWPKIDKNANEKEIREALDKSNFKKEPDDGGLKARFRGRSIDLYFDEIHKGGSTDNSKSIIYTLKNNSTINIFVMVTATFAKPSAKYTGLDFIGAGQGPHNNDTKTIEWSYNDQQYMKKLTDETKLAMFLNTRDGLQRNVLAETFQHYRKYGGASYLTSLSSEYAKYPELVLLSPQSIDIKIDKPEKHEVKLGDISTIDVRNVFIGNLKCDACKPNEDDAYYRNFNNIFNKIQPVRDLLHFIGVNIRNYMNNVIDYRIERPHTELWFLPDKNLYRENIDCKTICRPAKIEQHLDGASGPGEDAKTGIANIEPLTRGLAYMITEEDTFKQYNVFIVHNTPLTYLRDEGTKQKLGDINTTKLGLKTDRICVYDKKEGSIAKQIKRFERESYKDHRSVIILTGAKLRLGISLPCADIAFNFDDIKSIDANYQTMFRVLTEREKPELKKYGYYFDFNKDRAIQFLYEYNNVYGEAKKGTDIQKNVEELQSLLFTFNYNGLNIIKKDPQTEVSLYSKLITELELTREGYTKFWSQKENIVNDLKRVLSNSDINDEILQKLYKVMKISKFDKPKHKNTKPTLLKQGEKQKETAKQVVGEGEEGEGQGQEGQEGEGEEGEGQGQGQGQGQEGQSQEKEQEGEDEDYGVVRNHIAESLPVIIALLAMFSVDTNHTPLCDNIKDCLQRSLDDILKDDTRCKCENIIKNIDAVNILDCYFNSGKYDEDEEKQRKNAQKYTPEELKVIVKSLYDIITDGSVKNELFSSRINNIFHIIREAIEENSKMPKEEKHGLIYGMSSDDIEQKILSYLSVRQEEKDKYGEVFTPMKLINEMFDQLPKDIWSDPTKKWLDPANGIGNFPMVAYMRLMDGLKDISEFSNPEKRSKHIIQNMLYMVEINPKNVKISRRIFGSHANICCADFLNEQDKVLRQFGIQNFDVIIGNPPFQDEVDTTREGGDSGGGGPRKGGKNKLYERMTISCIHLLKTNGYLIFVTPDNIMTGNTNKAYEEIIKHRVIYVNFNNIKRRYFPTVGQSMCYFLIQNKKDTPHKRMPTTIQSGEKESIEVELKDRSINPVNNWTLHNEKLMDKYITNHQNGFIRTKDIVKLEGSSGKITVIVNSEKDYTTNDDTIQGYKIRKYILYRMQPSAQGRLDKTGRYGLFSQIYYLPLKDYTDKQIESIKEFFESDMYRTLQQVTTTGQYLKDAFIKSIDISKIIGEKSKVTKPKEDEEEGGRAADSKKGGGSNHGKSRRRSRTQKHRITRKKRFFGIF
jgi:hypothetical protein